MSHLYIDTKKMVRYVRKIIISLGELIGLKQKNFVNVIHPQAKQNTNNVQQKRRTEKYLLRTQMRI